MYPPPYPAPPPPITAILGPYVWGSLFIILAPSIPPSRDLRPPVCSLIHRTVHVIAKNRILPFHKILLGWSLLLELKHDRKKQGRAARRSRPWTMNCECLDNARRDWGCNLVRYPSTWQSELSLFEALVLTSSPDTIDGWPIEPVTYVSSFIVMTSILHFEKRQAKSRCLQWL